MLSLGFTSNLTSNMGSIVSPGPKRLGSFVSNHLLLEDQSTLKLGSQGTTDIRFFTKEISAAQSMKQKYLDIASPTHTVVKSSSHHRQSLYPSQTMDLLSNQDKVELIKN